MLNKCQLIGNVRLEPTENKKLFILTIQQQPGLTPIRALLDISTPNCKLFQRQYQPDAFVYLRGRLSSLENHELNQLIVEQIISIP